MAITLGEIAVKLLVNSAEFISGFNAAGASTKKFRAELSEHMSAAGEVIERGLAQFGEFGEQIGGTLARASAAAGQAVVSFGKLGGGMGTVIGVGAGAAAALAVVEAGAVGIALHTAEAAARMGEMAEKAGLSTETFAGLSVAGKSVGVETESIVKAFGFLSSNLFKSATSADFSKTALGRLGFTLKDIKDSSGNIRDLGDIFPQIAGKIAALPTSEQGAILKALFGRGGIEILPLINEGMDKIREKMEFAKTIGLGDPQTIAAARLFKETVQEIKDELEGMALLLTKDLLPMFQFLAERVKEAFADGSAQGFINGLANLVKGTVAVGDTFYAVFQQIKANWAFTIELIEAPFKAIAELGKAIWGSISPYLAPIGSFFSSIFQFWKSNVGALSSSMGDLFGGLFSAIGSAFEFVWDRLRAILGKVADFLHLKPAWDDIKAPFANWATSSKKIWADNASFINGVFSPGKTLPVQAPHGGDNIDLSSAKEDTTLARLKERLASLEREQQDWANTAAAATSAETVMSKAVQKGNEAFGKFADVAAHAKAGTEQAAQAWLKQHEAAIKAAAANVFYDQTLVKLNEDLFKQRDETAEAANASAELAEAYKQGGAAIVEAKIDQQFAKEIARLNELKDVRDVSAGLLALMASKSNAAAKASNDLQVELNREDATALKLKPKIDALNDAYLKGTDAVRAANIDLQVQRFIQDSLDKKVQVSTEMIKQKRDALELADKQAYDGALKQEAAQYNLNLQYQETLTKLQRIAGLPNSGASMLGLEAQLFDEQNRLIHQWDEWAFKVGTFGQRFKGVMGELIIQGRNAGQAISNAFLTAIDGVETGLAKILTGQKADFKSVFTGLAESVTKAQIQRGVGALAEHFGFKLPGKADGSDGNPFYVILKNAGVLSPLAAGTIGNIPLFGAPGTTPGGSSGGGIGGFFSSLLGAFTGFHALGGSIGSGEWGIAGERGPEIITGPANITPAAAFTRRTSITNNFHYASSGDRDMWGRSDRQNAARHMRNLRLALSH